MDIKDLVQIVQNFYTALFRIYYLTELLEKLKIELYKLQREITDDYIHIEWERYINGFKYIEWKNIDNKFKNFEEVYKLCAESGRCQIDVYEANIHELTLVNYFISHSGGDDEWLFVFQDDGKLLTVGSKYHEIVVWAETSLVSQFSNADDLLTNYWGIGLPGFWEARKQSFINKSLTIQDIQELLEQKPIDF